MLKIKMKLKNSLDKEVFKQNAAFAEIQCDHYPHWDPQWAPHNVENT